MGPPRRHVRTQDRWERGRAKVISLADQRNIRTEVLRSGYTVKSIDEMAAMHHGLVQPAGAEHGTENFGMQLLDIPAGFNDYPAHDHAEVGHEEVYVLLRGSAEVEVAGERIQLEPGQMVRVSP